MRWQSTPCPISCSSTRLHGRPSQKDMRFLVLSHLRFLVTFRHSFLRFAILLKMVSSVCKHKLSVREVYASTPGPVKSAATARHRCDVSSELCRLCVS